MSDKNVVCFYCLHRYETHVDYYGGCVGSDEPCDCPGFVPVGMVESVDTTVSKTVAERRAGSTPAPDTNLCPEHGAPVRVIVCPECLWKTKVPFEIDEDYEP